MLKKLAAIGPGAIVAAAFIGPGTLTVAITAGESFGYDLLWSVAFSTCACLVLQEMSVRLGVVGRTGVGEAIRSRCQSPALKICMIGIALSAVLVGNAAYEGGNISGGVLGVKLVVGDHVDVPNHGFQPRTAAVLTITAVAFALLWTAKYKIVERALIALVATMGGVFLSTAIAVGPSIGEILTAISRPSMPPGSWVKVVALIGTTVVPYNLFLHASTAKNRWAAADALPQARLDSLVSIVGGGVITAAILITSAAVFSTTAGAESAANSAEPAARSLAEILNAMVNKFGGWFGWFMAIGFLAAGTSSAITAPMAAAFAAAELFGWPKQMDDWRFRSVWIAVLAFGAVFAVQAASPQQMIVFAQFANGLLLPILAAFLIWAANDRSLLQEHKNSMWANAMGGLVLVVTVGLGLFGIIKSLGLLNFLSSFGL